MRINDVIEMERQTAKCSIPEMAAYHNQIAEWLEEYMNISIDYCFRINQAREDESKKIIDALTKELMHWEDWILAESPCGYHNAIEYSADDMQRMICRTIRECSDAIYKVIKENNNG